jgi:hypothetical protein
MKATTMYLPDSPEDLIALTRDAFLDLRVRERLIALSPGLDPEEADAANLARHHQNLLPDNSNANVLRMRAAYGWSRAEMGQIRTLLRRVAHILRGQADEVVLSGTASTLRRDADLVDKLVDHWTP